VTGGKDPPRAPAPTARRGTWEGWETFTIHCPVWCFLIDSQLSCSTSILSDGSVLPTSGNSPSFIVVPIPMSPFGLLFLQRSPTSAMLPRPAPWGATRRRGFDATIRWRNCAEGGGTHTKAWTHAQVRYSEAANALPLAGSNPQPPPPPPPPPPCLLLLLNLCNLFPSPTPASAGSGESETSQRDRSAFTTPSMMKEHHKIIRAADPESESVFPSLGRQKPVIEKGLGFWVWSCGLLLQALLGRLHLTITSPPFSHWREAMRCTVAAAAVAPLAMAILSATPASSFSTGALGFAAPSALRSPLGAPSASTRTRSARHMGGSLGLRAHLDPSTIHHASEVLQVPFLFRVSPPGMHLFCRLTEPSKKGAAARLAQSPNAARKNFPRRRPKFQCPRLEAHPQLYPFQATLFCALLPCPLILASAVPPFAARLGYPLRLCRSLALELESSRRCCRR
jgi:hypothetical protein